MSDTTTAAIAWPCVFAALVAPAATAPCCRRRRACAGIGHETPADVVGAPAVGESTGTPQDVAPASTEQLRAAQEAQAPAAAAQQPAAPQAPAAQDHAAAAVDAHRAPAGPAAPAAEDGAAVVVLSPDLEAAEVTAETQTMTEVHTAEATDAEAADAQLQAQLQAGMPRIDEEEPEGAGVPASAAAAVALNPDLDARFSGPPLSPDLEAQQLSDLEVEQDGPITTM